MELTIAQRHENLLKAIYACRKDLPEEFSARHLHSRTVGLALKDPKNFELKIALTNCLGPTLTIKKIGVLLQEKLSGVRIGDFRLDGRRTKAGDTRVSWKYFLQVWNPPVEVQPALPEVKLDREERKLFKDPADRQVVLNAKKYIAKDEAAEKLAKDQQRRLERAQSQDYFDEMAALKQKNKDQQRALKMSEEASIMNPHMTKSEEAQIKPFPKFKEGLKIDRPGHECDGGVFHLDHATGSKTIRMPTGKIWTVSEVEVLPPDNRVGGDMLRWYEEQSFLAMQRGDTRSIEQIAYQSRVWDTSLGISKVGGAIDTAGGIGNFHGERESDSDFMDRKFRGY